MQAQQKQERRQRAKERQEAQALRRRAIRSGKVIELYDRCELTGIHYRPDEFIL
jgi:hypothetical protein